jgi:acyl-CoA dehydrogenase
MQALAINICDLDDKCEVLRQELREFLTEKLADYPGNLRAHSWSKFDADFSRSLGACGWIGMTWPKAYGGHERNALERYVVLEELLAAGAPVGAHWIADRQSGPLLLKYGTEKMRKEILPRIAVGEAFFCIGMSEPDSGSDLASIRSRAERVGDGWVVNGTKLWTTNAHLAHYMITLVRTGKGSENKHADLSQFLVDLKTQGITIRPIRDLSGEAHFNEVVFEDVLIPAENMIGAEGEGWNQVTAELALERSGPERYLSSIQLVIEMLDAAPKGDGRHAVALGRIIAEMATLRQMSLGIAGMLARNENPALAATVVKDLGTALEQRIPEIAHDLFGIDLGYRDSSLADVMAYIVQSAPGFSIRAGTREILRGIIARGLGLR